MSRVVTSGWWRRGLSLPLLPCALLLLHCASSTPVREAPRVAAARESAVRKLRLATEQPSTPSGRRRAMELLTAAVAEDDQLWEARYDLGVLLAGQGKLAPAVRQLVAARELAPNAEDVTTALSEVLRRQGDARRAARVLEDFVARHPAALRARRAWIVALRESGQVRASLAQARALLERRPGDPAALAELALCHLAEGQVDVAELVARQALEANADSAVVRRAAGLVALERGEDALAFTHFARATQLDPKDTAAGLNTATVYLRAGVFEQAEKHFRMVLKAEPDSVDAKLGLAAALRGQGSRDRPEPYRECESVLLSLLESLPEHWVASYNLAVLYAESLDRPADAVAQYLRFLSRAPTEHPARMRARRWVDDHAGSQNQALE